MMSLLLLTLMAIVHAGQPRLVVHSNLADLYYCGTNPHDSSTFPRIPPLSTPLQQQVKLVQVQAFIRHGDRMFWGEVSSLKDFCWPGQENTEFMCSLTHESVPGTSFSGDFTNKPLLFRKRYIQGRNDYRGNCRVGQLTLKGHEQEMIHGQAFAEAYVGRGRLLASDLVASEVYVRSDDVPRTILSAQSFIQGMFPLLRSDGSHHRKQRVVDLWTMDANLDDEVANTHVCPGYAANRRAARSSPAYVKHVNESQALYARVAKVFGVSPDTLGSARTQDCMFVSACRGAEMPENITRALMLEVDRDQAFRFYYPLQYPDLQTGTRLSAGPLVRELFRRMKTAQAGPTPNEPKFFLYSGHDTGPIMLLLSALQADDPRWVPYASFISLELYEDVRDATRFFVRAIFNGVTMKLPGCEDVELCPFERFAAHIEPMIPTPEQCPEAFRPTEPESMVRLN